MSYIKVILKSGKDQSVRRYHPWVFSGAIKKIKGVVNEGDLVEVFDNKDEFLAIGHYQIGSIAIRILSFSQRDIEDSFWRERIEKAWKLRTGLGLLNEDYNNSFRLIHAEGDNLPGLIIDFYDGVAVIQTHSIGMYLQQDSIIAALKEVLADNLKAVYSKSENTLPFKAQIDKPKDGYIFGNVPQAEILEYGNKFIVDWQKGQKTGFFLDQRENRKLLEQYSRGRNVLNLFGFTGGFSVYAMRGGANLVHSVDSSASAIDLTNKNIALNFEDTSRHDAYVLDAFEYLEDIQDKYERI